MKQRRRYRKIWYMDGLQMGVRMAVHLSEVTSVFLDVDMSNLH